MSQYGMLNNLGKPPPINPCTQPKLACQYNTIHNEELRFFATHKHLSSTWGNPGHRQQLWFPQCVPYTAKQCSAGVGHSK